MGKCNVESVYKLCISGGWEVFINLVLATTTSKERPKI